MTFTQQLLTIGVVILGTMLTRFLQIGRAHV